MSRITLRSILPGSVALCCAMVFLGVCITIAVFPTRPDYSVFWAAARFALTRPEFIYNDAAMTLAQAWLSEVGRLRPWAYPPTALLPLLPFASLPFVWSLLAFTGISLILFAYAVRSMMGSEWWFKLAIVMISYPVVFAAINGQMIFLVGALIVGGLLALDRRPLLAGVMLGVAAALKPQLLMLAPIALVAARQYQALGASIVAGLTMGAVSLLLGPSLWLDWWRALPRFVHTVNDLGIFDRGITPTAMMWAAGINGLPQTVLTIFFGIAGAAWVWMAFRRGTEVAPRLTALVGGALLGSPYAMNYDLTILTPAAVIFLFNARNGGSLPLAVASGALLMIDGPFAPPVALTFLMLAMADGLGVRFKLPQSMSREKMTEKAPSR